jgi:hypothetical protein
LTSGKASPGEWQQTRALLTNWRDNDVKIEPVLQGSAITLELVPELGREQRMSKSSIRVTMGIRILAHAVNCVRLS